MRFLFLLLTLILQLNVSGYNLHNPQENHEIKILTAENEDFNERSCILFRYYSPDEGMYISQDPIGLFGGFSLYSYVHNPNTCVDILGLSGQRWEGQVNNDGSPRQKPGPKPAGEGLHNQKREEIIAREEANGSSRCIGGGNGYAEQTLKTPGGHKDERRVDTSFIRLDENGNDIKGSEYHINIGLSLADGEIGIAREREALEDLDGQNVTFEAYARDCDTRKK